MELTIELGFTIAYAVIMIAAFIGNTLLIYIVWKKPETRSLTGFLFVNMAVADLLNAVFHMPVYITHFYVFDMSAVQGVLLCRFSFYLVHVLMTASIFSPVVMAFDRYFAVVHPFRGIIWFRKAKIIIPVIWVASLTLMAITPVVSKLKSGKCYYIEENMPMLPFWTYILLINYILPLAIISALYVTVARKLWFHEIPGQDENSLSQPGEQIPKKRVVRTLIIVVVVFAVCWLPLQVVRMDYAVKGMMLFDPILIYFAYWLSQANSAINPWLYIGLNGNMNAAFSRMIRRRQEENVRRYRPPTSNFRSSKTVNSVV